MNGRPLRRVAILSLHTSPLAQPGAGDAGGMNTYVRYLALELGRAGIAVDIFTRAVTAGEPQTTELGPGVHVHHVHAGPPGRLAKEALPAFIDDFAANLLALKSRPRHEEYDLIHSHYWISGVAGLRMARGWKIPLVHTMHTMAKVKNLRLHSGEHPEPDLRVEGEQQIVDAADLLIANTRTEAHELVDLYSARPERISVVPPGVDLEVFSADGRDRARAGRGVRPEEFHLLFAGRIQRLKGPHILLAAAGLLRSRRPEIRLRITILGAGSGQRALDLKPLAQQYGIAEALTLYPPVDADSLAEWFRAADVVAMPSFSESFGLVALEAQACGTPVVAARVGGLPDAVDHQVTGLLLDSHDPQEWADALERLYDDVDLRHRMGKAAAARAEDFGWPRTAELTLAGYQQAGQL